MGWQVIVFFWIWLGAVAAMAQTRLTGRITDEEGKPIASVMIKVYAPENTQLLNFTSTKADGSYLLKFNHPTKTVLLQLNRLGFHPQEVIIKNVTSQHHFSMKTGGQNLREVTVRAPVIHRRGDTLRYHVDRVAGRNDRTIEDVLTRLPGVSVDATGMIKYNGLSINSFYIEGLNMLDNRYQLATQNIRPEEVSAIEILENHEPIKMNRDLNASERAAINLKLKKKSLARPVGNVHVGGGGSTEELLGVSELFGMLIMSGRQHLVTIKGNNTSDNYAHERGEEDFVETKARTIFPSTPFGQAPLPKERYYHNLSVFGSFHHLFRLNHDQTLTIAADYTFDDADYALHRTIDYWWGDQQKLSLAETTQTALRRQQARLFTKYERNADSLFLQNKLNMRATFNRNFYNIVGHQNVRQQQPCDDFSLMNDLNLSWKNGQQRWTLASIVGVGATPTTFMNAQDLSSDTLLIHQQAKGWRFYTGHSIESVWSLGTKANSRLGLKAMVRTDYENLTTSSEYYLPLKENQLDGWSISSSLSVYLRMQWRRHKWDVFLPIHWQNIHYIDRIEQIRYRLSEPTLSPVFKWSWTMFHHVHASWTTTYGRTYGGLLNFLTHPYFTDYRSMTVFGDGALSKNDVLRSILSLYYNDSYKGRSASVEGSFSRRDQNSTIDTHVAESGSMVSLSNRHRNISYQWDVNAQVSQTIYDWHSVFSLSANAGGFHTEQLRQGNSASIENIHYQVGFSSKTTCFGGSLICHFSGRFGENHQKMMGSLVRLKNYGGELHTVILPMKKLRLYSQLRFDNAESSPNTWSSNLFVDAGLSWMLSKKWELDLQGRNLTNRKHFSQYYYSLSDYYSYTYHLRPLEILMTAKWMF